jgi:asparagine synthase (glutamine-hydrolysing)
MWAFAIWDRTTRRLFCSTDRFGIKPFYYIFNNGNFYFASEYKPLKLVPDFKSDLNYDQIFRGLQLGWLTYEDETYFDCIQRLPSAHNLIFDPEKGITTTRYWDIYHKPKLNGQFENRAEKFRELFQDSVKIHNRSDVQVGACLSGGLDSSAIVSALAAMYPEQQIKTFNIFYTGKDAVDERPWMMEVPAKYQNVEAHTYSPPTEELWDAFEQSQYYADVPLSASSPVSQYAVMREAAKQGCKVLLDGQGSDEYLAG